MPFADLSRRRCLGVFCTYCGALPGYWCRTRFGTAAGWPHEPREIDAARLGVLLERRLTGTVFLAGGVLRAVTGIVWQDYQVPELAP